MSNSLPPRSCSCQSAPGPRKTSPLRRRVLTLTGLGLAGLVAGLLTGCSTSTSATDDTTAPSLAALAGNWRFSIAGATDTARISSLGGSLSVQGSTLTGIVHALVPGQCLDPAEIVAVSGSVTTEGLLTLSGQSRSATTVTLSGTVAADRHSLLSPTISATGGRCTASTTVEPGFAQAHLQPSRPQDGSGTTAQQYQPLTGTYTGTLTTADGDTFPLTTTVTELDQPDSSGVYHVQGTASSSANPCLSGSVPATASTVSGGLVSASFTDTSGNAINASGTAAPDASTITLSSWSVSGPCGSGTGSGTLVRQ